jgi:hypothetical protein
VVQYLAIFTNSNTPVLHQNIVGFQERWEIYGMKFQAQDRDLTGMANSTILNRCYLWDSIHNNNHYLAALLVQTLLWDELLLGVGDKVQNFHLERETISAREGASFFTVI